ncbi:hypothetical protein BJ166DRAFT_526126 [Pestalotiopsis sp. NC0098]|nr:hypothetical protein BJ166DRAFT_526126 [Pestalotiopsis sp. NC0098]
MLNIVTDNSGLTRASLMRIVVAQRWYIMDVHPEFANTVQFMSDSAPRLLLSMVGDPIPLNRETLSPTPLYLFEGPTPLDCYSYLGHLLPYESCSSEIMKTISSIGGREELASNLWFDRSLLVMMSYSRPWLGRLVALLTQGNDKLGPVFSFDTVLREMRERHGSRELSTLIRYLTTNGHPDTVRLLVLEGFDAATMIIMAAERMDDQILDCLLDKDTKWGSIAALRHVVHFNHISHLICEDSAFRAKLVDILAFRFRDEKYNEVVLANSEYSPLAELLTDMTMHGARRYKIDEIPLYVSLLIDECISRYESSNLSFPGDLWSFVHIVSLVFDPAMRPETDQAFRWEDRILQRLLSTEYFRSGIEYVPKQRVFHDWRTLLNEKGFTPIMVALQSGMVSTVKLLLDAGAQINSRSPYGISALQLAERDSQDDLPSLGKFRAVSKDTNEAMLKLLRETLRSRGEEVPAPKIPDIGIDQPLRPFRRVYRKVQELIKTSLSWLLKPTANITQESLSKRFEYIAVVWFVGLLSVTKLLQPSAKWFAAVGLRQFSRPVFLVPIMAWFIMTIWRYYVAEL